MKKINIAIIGCGRIAGHHARNILAHQDLNLVSVCDLDLEKAQAYGKEFKVPVYGNYREMLMGHPEINVVALCTPSGMHYEHAHEILSKFNKNVIIEKPTCLKISHLKNLYKLAAEKRLSLFPVFQNRYNKSVQRLKKALVEKELGDLRIISVRVRWCRPQRYYDLSAWRGTYAMDGGAITNQGIHHIDLIKYLGGEVVEVSSQMATLGADIEVEDTCVSTLRFASGAVGVLEITTSARPDDFEASISVVGSKGLAQIGGIAVNEMQIFSVDPTQTAIHSEDFSKNVYGHGHQQLYSDIARFFSNKPQQLVQAEDALQTLGLLHSFYLSDETNSKIDPRVQKESHRLGRVDEKLAILYRTQGAKYEL